MPETGTASRRQEVLARLADHMQSLYRTGAYFVSVPPAATPDFEEGYWAEIVDPDGRRRNRLTERDQVLDDLKAELAYVRTLTPGRVLDAGCGLGWFLSALDRSWERHGLELSSFAAGHARQFAEVRPARLEDCAYPDDFFDVVLCHHVIEHVPDPVVAIGQIHRVLRPSGILILGTPDFDSGAARRWGSRYRLLHDPTHISLFANDSMHRFLRDHGFHIDKVHYPYFETRHFTEENLLRLLADQSEVSPPFYGNFMTFYCHKPAQQPDP
jgi:SAM-dependent methyltransferase